METWNLRWFHVTPKSNKLKPEVSAPALGGFTKLENQINWNQRFRLLVGSEGRSGVRAWAETPAGFAAENREYHLRQEPNTLDLIFLILVSHEYHLRFSSFHVKIFVNTIQNFLTTQWNPGHKIKKICAVFIEIPHWWFFAKNTAAAFYNVLITNSVAHCLGRFQSSYFIFNHPLQICSRRFNLLFCFAIPQCQNKKIVLHESTYGNLNIYYRIFL